MGDPEIDISWVSLKNFFVHPQLWLSPCMFLHVRGKVRYDSLYQQSAEGFGSPGGGSRHSFRVVPIGTCPTGLLSIGRERSPREPREARAFLPTSFLLHLLFLSFKLNH